MTLSERIREFFFEDVLLHLRTIERKLDQLTQKENQMATDFNAALAALTAKVTEAETVEQSAVTMIQGLAAQITANKNDPTALQALADRLTASDTSLATAITANTPAEPTA